MTIVYSRSIFPQSFKCRPTSNSPGVMNSVLIATHAPSTRGCFNLCHLMSWRCHRHMGTIESTDIRHKHNRDRNDVHLYILNKRRKDHLTKGSKLESYRLYKLAADLLHSSYHYFRKLEFSADQFFSSFSLSSLWEVTGGMRVAPKRSMSK